jgi:hypothetical protein
MFFTYLACFQNTRWECTHFSSPLVISRDANGEFPAGSPCPYDKIKFPAIIIYLYHILHAGYGNRLC